MILHYYTYYVCRMKKPTKLFSWFVIKTGKNDVLCGFCCLIISGCVLLFYLLKGFLPHCTVFSWGIGPCFDIFQFVLILPWNQRIICHLEGPFVRFACVSVFRDDSVEPYVPSVLNGNSIERFPRHRERAVKHL